MARLCGLWLILSVVLGVICTMKIIWIAHYTNLTCSLGSHALSRNSTSGPSFELMNLSIN